MIKAFTIATACLLAAGVSAGECVTVWSGPAIPEPIYQQASREVRILAVQDGKPLVGASLSVFFGAEDKASLLLATDQRGLAVVSRLRPGRYHIVALSPDRLDTAVLYMEVPEKAAAQTSSFLIDLTASDLGPPITLAAPAVNTAPINDYIRQFKGVVSDVTGAVIPKAQVQVYRRGEEVKEPVAKLRADVSGRFSAQLAPGAYVAFLESPGFKTRIVGFEIGPQLQAKDLQIQLVVGGC
jgi:hypothetical protein